jgi:ATP-dependent helicase/nuclease subunit A
MRYITDPAHPANIDQFLMITFTKAAASELRAKIAAKLGELVAADPQNAHLRRQTQRLYLTKIATVHGFCSDVLREYAYYLNIPGDFRVADENECNDLRIQVMEKLLEEAYQNKLQDTDFLSLIGKQGLGRDDRQIPQIVLQVYDSARCHLNPQLWLSECEKLVS